MRNAPIGNKSADGAGDHRRGLRWIAGGRTPAKVYITRVFNFGTDREWRAMKRRFSGRQVRDAVRRPLRGQWTRRGKAFAEALYGGVMGQEALISYDA